MYLTPEQQAILDGSKGEVMVKVMYDFIIFYSCKIFPETFSPESIRRSRPDDHVDFLFEEPVK